MSIDAKIQQLQFPFMIDVNMRMYRDYTMRDYHKWKKLFHLENVPDNNAMELYAESLNHRGFGDKWQNRFFADNHLIMPYDEYYRRLGMQTQNL